MAAGMPVGVYATVLAQKYKAHSPTISTAVLLSTLLTVVTQSILLLVFAGQGG
jgi:predicted permease